MKMVEIHTSEEVDAMVDILRPMVDGLIATGEVRPLSVEADLRVVAYNRLTELRLLDDIKGLEQR